MHIYKFQHKNLAIAESEQPQTIIILQYLTWNANKVIGHIKTDIKCVMGTKKCEYYTDVYTMYSVPSTLTCATSVLLFQATDCNSFGNDWGKWL